MAGVSTSGLLVISVDVDEPGDAAGRSSVLGSSMAERLWNLFERRGAPATFAVSHPADSRFAAKIAEGRGRHELALLGDESWVGASAGRTRFARELAWRTRRAHDAGLTISSLALRGVKLAEHLDLLVKHRISAVREGDGAPNVSRSIRPQLYRFGIWKASATCRFPAPTGIWKRADSAMVASVRRAAQRGEVTHVLFDLAGVQDEGAIVRAAERLLAAADPLVAAGHLSVCTLAEAVSMLSLVESRRRSQSALRAA